MPGAPDLFVVCKNCRAEVSPYITECPYCGHRLRKRAPKLDKGAAPRREGRRSAVSRLGRLRPGEIPGIRADRRPYMAIALILIPILVTLLVRLGAIDALDIAMVGGTQGDWWRPITTQLYYGSTAYEIVCLGAIFLFA